jgi:hypothetical protein
MEPLRAVTPNSQRTRRLLDSIQRQRLVDSLQRHGLLPKAELSPGAAPPTIERDYRQLKAWHDAWISVFPPEFQDIARLAAYLSRLHPDGLFCLSVRYAMRTLDGKRSRMTTWRLRTKAEVLGSLVRVDPPPRARQTNRWKHATWYRLGCPPMPQSFFSAEHRSERRSFVSAQPAPDGTSVPEPLFGPTETRTGSSTIQPTGVGTKPLPYTATIEFNQDMPASALRASPSQHLTVTPCSAAARLRKTWGTPADGRPALGDSPRRERPRSPTISRRPGGRSANTGFRYQAQSEVTTVPWPTGKHPTRQVVLFWVEEWERWYGSRNPKLVPFYGRKVRGFWGPACAAVKAILEKHESSVPELRRACLWFWRLHQGRAQLSQTQTDITMLGWALPQYRAWKQRELGDGPVDEQQVINACSSLTAGNTIGRWLGEALGMDEETAT